MELLKFEDLVLNKIDPDKFIYMRNEPNNKGVLNVPENKIVEIPNFITQDAPERLIHYFENCGVEWGDIAFYGSSGKGLKPDAAKLAESGLPSTFFEDIKSKFQESVETVFGKKVRANTSHAQKWDVGGFAPPHSDNSDNDGTPNAFEINKYVAILYLNDDYEGGELYFLTEWPGETWLSFKPNKYSLIIFPGGVENIHGVSEITKGTRYTMVSFWDFADLEYDKETLEKWEEMTRVVRQEQAVQKEEWKAGIGLPPKDN